MNVPAKNDLYLACEMDCSIHTMFVYWSAFSGSPFLDSVEVVPFYTMGIVRSRSQDFEIFLHLPQYKLSGHIIQVWYKLGSLY